MLRAAVILVFIGSVAVLSAQSAQVPVEQPAPAFEVASIKRITSGIAGPGARRVGIQPGGRFVMEDGSVLVLIRSAYEAATEILGAPNWVESEHYDVETRSAGAPTAAQVSAMLRSLLAERFNFAAHYESREQPVYALVLARTDGRPGPQLRRYDVDCAAVVAAVRERGEKTSIPQPSNGAPGCGYRVSGGNIEAGGIELSRLGASVESLAGRPIIDKTGLEGYYEFSLKFSARPGSTDDAPSLFVALEEQLGLKLVPDRASMQVLVIDRLERPTPD